MGGIDKIGATSKGSLLRKDTRKRVGICKEKKEASRRKKEDKIEGKRESCKICSE